MCLMTLASELVANLNEIPWLLPRDGLFCTDGKSVATARGVREWDTPRLTNIHYSLVSNYKCNITFEY